MMQALLKLVAVIYTNEEIILNLIVEDKHLSFVISVTYWSCMWPRIKTMKNEYFLKDSINMMLVICLRVLNI